MFSLPINNPHNRKPEESVNLVIQVKDFVKKDEAENDGNRKPPFRYLPYTIFFVINVTVKSKYVTTVLK